MGKTLQTLVALASVPIFEDPETEEKLVTEVVAGERVGVLGVVDGWFLVVVPSHSTRLDERGYPGWARPEDLVPADGWNPTHRVANRVAGLPLGATVELRDGAFFLPDDREASLTPEVLLPLGEADTRSPADLAHEFSGLPYRWGGTDSTTGADCSGLVFRVMQLLGVEVPRDADDQFERAPFKSRDPWNEAGEGDLVFFGTKGVTHVGVYLGDGTYISEHGAGGTVVRAMTDDPYLGYARYP